MLHHLTLGRNKPDGGYVYRLRLANVLSGST